MKDREAWIKLDILNSLARSQRALASIIESVADSVEASPLLARHVAENLEAISRYQRIVAYKMFGIKIRKKTRGIPAKAWLNPTISTKHKERTTR
jgi:hypothetical protein